MTRRARTLLAAALVAAASAGLLAAAIRRSTGAVPQAVPPTEFLAKAYPAAAQQAGGRRVLVLRADPGAQRSAEILESHRAPEGWRLFPATDGRGGAFDAALAGLAGAAAAAFDPRTGFPAEVERALALFAVKTVLVDDAGKATTQTLRALAQAEPVLRLDGGEAAGAADAVTLSARLRTSTARESSGWTWSDWEDLLWGGAVTVETREPGRFVLPYPSAGARVTVDGADAATSQAGPLLVVDLPAGAARIEVRGAPEGRGGLLAVAGAAGLLASLLAALLALRPSLAEVESAAGPPGA